VYALFLFNPFTDKQLNVLGTMPNKFAISVHFLYFVWDAKRLVGRAVRRLIVLHPMQDIESEL